MAVSLWAQDPAGGSSSTLSNPYEGAGFTGRSPVRIGLAGAESVPITISISVNGSYDSLLGAFRTDSKGNLTPGTGSYGVDGGFSLAGQKKLRRSVFGISYFANYSHFFNVSSFNGTNQSVNLAYSRRITKRTELTWTTAGSITNRVIGNPLNRQTDGLELIVAPVNELFDSRLYFLQSNLAVSYLLNNRWQLQFVGNGGIVRRQARALADVNLYGGTSGASYRINRRSTIGFNVTYSHFNFGKQFGESDIYGVSANYSRQFGRGWTGSAHVTGYDARTVGVRQVALDPVIAALLGTNQGAEAFQSTTKTPGYGANMEKRFRRNTISLGVDRSVQPGNGLYLTSIATSYIAGTSYQLKDKWSLNASASRMMMSNLGTGTLGTFSNDGVMVGVSRMITREIGIAGGTEYRQFKVAGSALDRRGSRVTFGLNYNPTSLPFGK